MVWLRPIEQPAGAAATAQPAAGVTRTEPTLDDGTAARVTVTSNDPDADRIAAITARRAQEHKRALDVLSASQSMVPSASTLTRFQLEMLKPQPSPYQPGLLSSPTSNTSRNAARMAPPVARPPIFLPGGSAYGSAFPEAPEDSSKSSTRPTTSLLSALLAPPPSSPPLRLLPSSEPSQPPLQEQPTGKPTRSRSLVHLDKLPAKLSHPQVRPAGTSGLGAAVGPAGLGARGDAELPAAEIESLERERQHKVERRVVAPRTPLQRSATAPKLGGGDATARGGAPAATSLLESASAGDLLRLPTPGQLRKPSAALARLLPPEPSDGVLRARATDRRAALPYGPYASVRLSDPPAKFSSIASRATVPDSLRQSNSATTRQGSSSEVPPSRGGRDVGSQTADALGAQRGGSPPQVMRGSLRSRASSCLSTASPSSSRGYTPAAKASYAAVRERAPRASVAAPAPVLTPPSTLERVLGASNAPRDWVRKQAALDAEVVASRASARALASVAGATAAPPIPFVEMGAKSSGDNFIASKPVPKPARRSRVHGVPWLADHGR